MNARPGFDQLGLSAADFAQYRRVRADARRLGMPLIAWAYPRGLAPSPAGPFHDQPLSMTPGLRTLAPDSQLRDG